ncbi:MAG: hypothetical protein AB7E70_10335 [Hyphomicrobiaceae bacterium]
MARQILRTESAARDEAGYDAFIRRIGGRGSRSRISLMTGRSCT